MPVEVKTHITATPLQVKGDAAVDETPNADYPFRAVIERELFANVMLDYSLNIDYHNFKNSIKENNFHDHCVEVWAIMMRYGLNWGSFE